MLYNIQVLRAVAALMVVHGHAAAGGLGLDWIAGGMVGVDLFFVISGFIIAYVADLDSEQFMLRRVIRIVPIYWVSTLAIYALAVLVPQYMRTTSSDPELLVRSLLFIPDASGVHTNDGVPHPTLAGGWTLNFEMYFYVTFWLALSFTKRWASLVSATILSAVIIVVEVSGLGERSPVAHFYGYPIILEFMFGMLAFHLVRHAERRHLERIAPLLQRAVLLGLAGGGIALLLFNRELFAGQPRWFSAGIPAFFVVLAAVLLERLHGWKITNRYAVLIGDASYVLYLSHAYVVFGVIRLGLGKRQFSEPIGQLVVIGLIAVSCVVAIAIYRWVEQPMLRVLKKRLVRRRVQRASAR